MDRINVTRWGFLTAVLAVSAAYGCAIAGRTGDQQRGPAFYSDLGPAEIDVSAYPPEQQARYALYKRACSQCHSLARSINAPAVGRGYWEFYTLAMRFRSKYTPGASLTKEEVREIVEFLDFDSQERKFKRKAEFDAHTERLKTLYLEDIDRRMRRMQESQQLKTLPGEEAR